MMNSPANQSRPAGRWLASSLDRRALLRRAGERAFGSAAFAFAGLVLLIILWIGFRLFADSSLTRGRYGLSFLSTSVWDVPHQLYGALPFLFGTIVSSLLSLVIAVPMSVGASLFLTEIAPRKVSNFISFVIELLAAIPSVIYGLWGFLVLCPFLNQHVSPWLADQLGANPLFAGPAVLTNMLAAGVILAIMILPIITSITREVLLTVPSGQREASLGLGATKWETIKNVILPEAKSGITGAVVLGLGRALGETMAVLMVIGNTPRIAASLLQPGYTMPSLLANQFNEAYTDEVQRSALLEIALLLFLVTVLVNCLARLLLRLTGRQLGNAEISPAAQAFKNLFDGAVRYGLGGIAVAFVGFQIFCDFRAKGFHAIVGPMEVVTLIAIGYRVAVRVTAGTKTGGKWRRITNLLMNGVLSIAAFLACGVLGALLTYVAMKGIHGLSPSLFTELPRPPGIPGGGLKSAILGTIELVAIAGAIGIPVGLMGGIYVAEFGQGKLGAAMRFAADVLNGVPSVVIGLFAYAAFVLPFGHFSGWAGAGALAIMMIPTIMRTTEEMLRLVPSEFRAASLALGASKVYTIRKVIVPAARSGILTGVMLATARVAGETAPLLFTAFGNDLLAKSPSEPVSTLTMKIYQYAISPYDDWVAQAWGGALILLMLILLFSASARLSSRRAAPAR